MVTHVAVLAAVVVVASVGACSASVETTNEAGGGGEPDPKPVDDQCEDVTPAFDSKAIKHSCCEAGCLPAASTTGALCVSRDRHCSVDVSGAEWERPCEAGYECMVIRGEDQEDPCRFDGEFTQGLHGFCIWKGEE